MVRYIVIQLFDILLESKKPPLKTWEKFVKFIKNL